MTSTRDANEVVNEEVRWSAGDWRLGSIGGDMDVVDGFRRKFMLLFEDDIEADGEVAWGGIVLRDWLGE